jgi:hypothetical protein
MFDGLLKIIERKIDPCRLCIVRPLCPIKKMGGHILYNQYKECNLYIKYKRRYEKFDNLFDSIHTGFIITVITLFCLYIAITFIMGIFKQYQLLFS